MISKYYINFTVLGISEVLISSIASFGEMLVIFSRIEVSSKSITALQLIISAKYI
jgi:hypothetical protein